MGATFNSRSLRFIIFPSREEVLPYEIMHGGPVRVPAVSAVSTDSNIASGVEFELFEFDVNLRKFTKLEVTMP
jgi:hypothetical protein